MKPTRFFSRTKKINKCNSLPKIIRSYALKSKNNENNLNNISATTNASALKNSINNSALLPKKNTIFLKKIKLNDKFKSKRALNNSEINLSNLKKSTIEILENADQIMKERSKFHGLGVAGGKQLLRSVALKISKDVCYKNYIIKLLKERRIEINEKECIINKVFENFNEQYEKDYQKFNNFTEEVKEKQRKEEEAIIEFRKIREKTEKIYESEFLLNKKLSENLERKIKELFEIKRYGSFVHKILGKNFIYDRIPEIKTREKNYEQIVDFVINLYETKGKYNDFPKELEETNSFMKNFIQLEDEILSNISKKELLGKEIEKIQENLNNELEQLKLSKEDYENDIHYITNDIKNVKLEMQNFKIHRDENFDDYLGYILELGKEIGALEKIPKIIDKKYLTDLVDISKKTLQKLRNLEDTINSNILKIENVLDYGPKKDSELMEQLILNQKNKNLRMRQLLILEKQNDMKILKNLQIIERIKKIVITGRKIPFNYPIEKKKNINKKIKKNEVDDDKLEYQYSNNDEHEFK